MRNVRTIELCKLREPERPARSGMDLELLDDLVQSIKDLGILEPLLVRAVDNGDFEVIAGHRRLRAATAAGLHEAPCVVIRDPAKVDAVRLHENLVREDLSPADEAAYYQQLYEQVGSDTEALAELVKRSRTHVENRLLLLQGDPEVLKALRAGSISVGVAEELNRIKRSEDRLYYLHYSVRNGVSIRQARDWRNEANLRAEMAERADLAAASGGAATLGGEPAVPSGPSYASIASPHELSSSEEERPCMFCRERHLEWRMFRKFVCSPCADRYLVPEAVKHPE